MDGEKWSLQLTIIELCHIRKVVSEASKLLDFDEKLQITFYFYTEKMEEHRLYILLNHSVIKYSIRIFDVDIINL